MLLQLSHVYKIYGELHAVDDLSLDVERGEWLAVVGSSGSGKTTLMNIIGCMDTPSKGTVTLDGRELGRLNASQLTDIRKNVIGLVFQQFHLIPHLTAVENVMVAQYYHSMTDEKEAMEALESVGLADRARVHVGDYRALSLPPVDGPTLFVGNPPYVRHHRIAPEWKTWLLETARRRGLDASALAGLHVHFFLATAEYGRNGDYGAFITSSEWLDVNYGGLVRQLLLDGLGGQSLHVLAPEAPLFSDATTTSAITCFRIGETPSTMRIRRVESLSDLGRLAGGRSVSRQRLAGTSRWSVLTRETPRLREGYVELGELCRVHRGTVTGANAVWVRRDASPDLPERVLFPSITKARELFGAGARLGSLEALRRVVDLPVDLDVLDDDEREQVDRFLREARARGVHEGYIASNRRAWWSVGLRAAAPILATYMARRPPAFVRNDAGARHINIAHGLYPRERMSDVLLDRLADRLRAEVTLAQGRTYAGGLVKFEPREMERIPVPGPDMLAEGA